MTKNKKCKHCGITQDIGNFSKRKNAKDGYWNICDKCKQKSYLPWNRKSSPSQSKFIYVLIADNGLVKIGVASDPQKRIRLLQTQSPIPISTLAVVEVKNAGYVEKIIHEKMKSYHSHGEWFAIDQYQIDWIMEEISCATAQHQFA